MLRFSSYFLVSFVAVGAYASWLAPFLDSRGVAASSIGFGFAAVSVLRAVTPPAWGWLADRLRRKHLLLAALTLASGAALSPLLLDGPPRVLLACTIAFGLFFAPLYALLDAQVLAFLGTARAGYGRIRMYGSVGFLSANLAMGPLVAWAGLGVVPWVMVAPVLAAAAIAAGFPTPVETSVGAAAAREPIPWRALWPVLAAVILAQASHSPYWAYFVTHLGERSVPPSTLGLLLATAIAAEIGLMGWAPRLIARHGARALLFAGVALGAVRWSVGAGSAELALVWPSQLLHAASYGLVYVASVALVDEAAPASRKAFAQTVLSACSHGVGLGGGFFLAGALVERLHFPGLALAAAALCVAGAVVLALARPRGP